MNSNFVIKLQQEHKLKRFKLQQEHKLKRLKRKQLSSTMINVLFQVMAWNYSVLVGAGIWYQTKQEAQLLL